MNSHIKLNQTSAAAGTVSLDHMATAILGMVREFRKTVMVISTYTFVSPLHVTAHVARPDAMSPDLSLNDD